ncbi:MAG: lamin tail domain-containing protein, partial [Akkermansiaceae bacterium]|nr:lamin tail domain-containing protein [Akkermansiaceae bacterium]
MSSFLGVAAPVITEFQADNSSTLNDEDGNNSDWIEIFNPDGSDYDLSGCYLTDDPTLLTKWQFPAGTNLEASKFLLVFASDKDRAVAGSELHTNFKISSGGEYLALVAADGTTVLSEYVAPYPVQFE